MEQRPARLFDLNEASHLCCKASNERIRRPVFSRCNRNWKVVRRRLRQPQRRVKFAAEKQPLVGSLCPDFPRHPTHSRPTLAPNASYAT